MVSVNLVMVAGNLVRDPELKYPSGSVPVCDFRIAATKRFSKLDGSKGESTVFIDVAAWRHTGELCAQFLKKGRPVLVVGELRQDRWTDKEGKKQSTIRITAQNVQFLGSKPEEKPPGPEAGAEAKEPEEEEEAAE